MTKTQKIIPFTKEEDIIVFLDAPTPAIAETLTGILGSDISTLKLSAGRLVQASLKNRLLRQLGKEIKYFREKGTIKNDFFDTPVEQQSLRSLLDYIDAEVPDAERFAAMKALFFYNVRADIEESRKLFVYEIMQVCKKLTSNQLLILKAAFEISKGNYKNGLTVLDNYNYNTWITSIAQQIGHHTVELVDLDDKRLVEMKLLADRAYSDGSGINMTKHFRLTTLGFELCNIITSEEVILE